MKTTLHSWTKLHSVMMSYSFYILESVCYYFVVDACLHEGSYSSSFFLPFLQYHHWVWVLQLCWPHKTNGEVFSERFLKDWCYIFHEYLVGFSSKSIRAGSLELYAGFLVYFFCLILKPHKWNIIVNVCKQYLKSLAWLLYPCFSFILCLQSSSSFYWTFQLQNFRKIFKMPFIIIKGGNPCFHSHEKAFCSAFCCCRIVLSDLNFKLRLFSFNF